MSDPALIAVAITGLVPRKSDNPAVPISMDEQIESTHEAYEAGASLAIRGQEGEMRFIAVTALLDVPGIRLVPKPIQNPENGKPDSSHAPAGFQPKEPKPFQRFAS